MDAIKDDSCFCCGRANEHGLRLAIAYPEAGRAETSLVVPEWFSGWRGVTHGGLLSMVLDEVMAHACMGPGQGAATAVTAEMTVRFLKPVPTGSQLRAEGRVTEMRGRIIRTEGRLVGDDGAAAAEASARFITAARKGG
jgi:uncharacterized protein (TIGR00369 family)